MKKIIRLLLFTTLFVNVTLAQTAMIKTEALTPHRLTTMGFTTNSVSSGLNNVPKQTYVYLSAWNIGNDEPISSATFTLISKPAFSTASLEVINPTWAQFKPDVLGTYTIGLSITTASGTHDTTANIYASEFVGVGGFAGTSATFPQCMSCHSSEPYNFTQIFDRWKISGHANVFNQQLEISDHYSANCMKCHTTGYDHNIAASNNGFDDIADSLGWSYIAPGNPEKWDSLVTYYPSLVNHATIGCENCHGPGNEHAYGGHLEKIGLTVDAGNCAQCHDEPWRHNKYSEFENSGHAEVIWSTSFAQGSSSQNNNLGNCIRCHDGQGYVNFTKGRTTNTTGMHSSQLKNITCAACHDPHGNDNEFSLRDVPAGSDTLGNGYQYTIGGTGRVCMNCHKARRDNVSYTQTNVTSAHWGPHHSVQTDVYLGQNAAEFDGVPYVSGYHKLVFDNACVDCHMVATTDTGTVTRDRVGGHSWKLHDVENNYFHAASCTPCHGEINSWDDFIASKDFDDDGTRESIPQEIAGLETLLRIQLPPVGIDSIDYNQITTENLKKAYFNYQLIAYDGSKGMHNARFAIDVLTKSIIAIGGTVDVEEDEYSSPTQYALIQNYPNPFNPSTTIRFNVPYDSDVKITIYNVTGEVVRVLVDAVTRAGLHEIEFNTYGTDLSSGIYFYTIEANAVDRSNSFRETKKMVLLK
ncbi:MAG: cytochrome c3 family protein [Ignavibacteria bacterium]|nr:cytochrome c3 family protein [Ignavibacteria bacterium]